MHFTQASAVERAQQLMSTNLCTREEKDRIAELIGDFRFSTGFGKTLSRFVRSGVGVHHAGLLPKYRRLVERLAQAGLLKVICGTDTLGVGINVPIRTVLFTALSKYDGTRTRHLSAREFHQIAGRAGRAGYDQEGSVVVQAPEHVTENTKALAKAGDDPKKRRKVVRKKPPEGFVSWGEATFERLVAAEPEPLTSSFAVSHSMVLNVLDRPGDGCRALRRLLTDNHEPRPAQRRHIRRAIGTYRSLLAAGVVERLDVPDDRGRLVRVTVDLQEDFALNQPLAPFALAAVELFDRDDPGYALDIVSVVEAVLDDPGVVLAAQLNKAKGDLITELKAAGMEYEERMARLDEVTYPKPLADELGAAFAMYAASQPWVADHPLSPKSIVRDLWERAMTFADFVQHYGLTRAEGTLLRYLSNAYKALVQTVPEVGQDRRPLRPHRVARGAGPAGGLQPPRRVGGPRPPRRAPRGGGHRARSHAPARHDQRPCVPHPRAERAVPPRRAGRPPPGDGARRARRGVGLGLGALVGGARRLLRRARLDRDRRQGPRRIVLRGRGDRSTVVGAPGARRPGR